VAKGMLGTPYDWDGIVADAMKAIGAQELWAQNWYGQGPPAHMVCSSLAAWIYQQVQLDIPTYHVPRQTTPGDWEQFILMHGYAQDLKADPPSA
jgi:cell wall-associated NlpC family hydrolase